MLGQVLGRLDDRDTLEHVIWNCIDYWIIRCVNFFVFSKYLGGWGSAGYEMMISSRFERVRALKRLSALFISCPNPYDSHPPPLHPYTRASSSFPAVVQLYARSALPTNLTMARRFQSRSMFCRFDCQSLEDAPHFRALPFIPAPPGRVLGVIHL
jgi:hypothetical protein